MPATLKPTHKLTVKPPVRPGKTGKPPLDAHTQELVKSVSKFLGKINKNLNKDSGMKLKLIPADAKITIKTDAKKKP